MVSTRSPSTHLSGRIGNAFLRDMYHQDERSSDLGNPRGGELLRSIPCLHSAANRVLQPALSILHTIYAIYHLCRPANGRTAGSSASYMLFAAILDAAAIPFYVLAAIISKVQHQDKTYGWDTMFETKLAADKIIYSTFLGCSVVGGLHLAALVIDIYLAVIFRKIAKLPPDMNPLEDSLSARPHKRSKSEVTEKHLSGSTAVGSNRGSLAQDPLMVPTVPIPFMRTRENSDPSLRNPQFADDKRSSYYSCQSARYSRSDLPSQAIKQFAQANRSKTDVARTPAYKRGSPSRPQSAIISNPPMLDTLQPEPTEAHLRDPSGVSSLTTMDNWITYGSEPPSPTSRTSGETMREKSPLNSRPGSPDDNLAYRGVRYNFEHTSEVGAPYAPLQLYNDDENVYGKAHTDNLYRGELDLGGKNNSPSEEEHAGGQTGFLLNPLEMNPPTPSPFEINEKRSLRSKGSLPREALADIPNLSVENSHSTPVKGAKEDKMRSYGELGQSPFSRGQGIHDDNDDDFLGPSKSAKTRWRRKSGKFTTYESLKADIDDSDGEGSKAVAPGETDRKGRVVSNTGIDLGTGPYSSYIAELGVGRLRDVSGKVAEEGRAGPNQVQETEAPRKLTRPRRLSKPGEIKAAGWARWRGL